MIGAIVRREWSSFFMAARVGLACALVLALTAAALTIGASRIADERRAAQRAQTESYRLWLDQGDKSPHSAAHFGFYAFRPAAPLGHVDAGLTRFSGAAVWLEAHKQNPPSFRAAEDATLAERFPPLTAAMLLQILVPLLLIIAGHTMLSGERESGTLRLALAGGASIRKLALGKFLALALLGMAMTLPVLLGAFAAPWLSGAGWAESIARALGFSFAALLYIGAFAALTIAVSALARSSREAMAWLLLVWAAATLLVPRIAGLTTEWLEPTPSTFAFRQMLDADLKQARAGLWPEDGSMSEFERKTLAHYGVKHRDELPVSMRGLVLQEDERVAYPVFDRHYGGLWERFQRQDELALVWLPLSPALALSRASMGFAGTDLWHVRRFLDAAEAHRRQIMELMNDDLVQHGARREYTYLAGREVWEKAPNFRYVTPEPAAAWRKQWPPLAALAAWFLLATVLAVWSVRRMKVLP